MAKNKIKYTVNLDEIETLGDIDAVFALGKHNAGLPLSDKELMSIVEWVIDNIHPAITFCTIECAKCKKLPWYKRFWNWLKKPFTKSK